MIVVVAILTLAACTDTESPGDVRATAPADAVTTTPAPAAPAATSPTTGGTPRISFATSLHALGLTAPAPCPSTQHHPHNHPLPAALVLITLTTATVLKSSANTKQMSPQAEATVLKLKEAAENIDAERTLGGSCGVFIKQLRELSQGAGKECREVLRKVMAKRAGV